MNPIKKNVILAILAGLIAGGFSPVLAMGRNPDPNDPSTNNRDNVNSPPGVTNTNPANPSNPGTPGASPFPNQGGLPNAGVSGTNPANTPPSSGYTAPSGTRGVQGTPDSKGSSGSR
jgi:hypothetical protein